MEAPKPRGHTGDTAVIVKRQPDTFGSLEQYLGQCLNPASRVSRLGKPEQTAFGLLEIAMAPCSCSSRSSYA